jgi:quercetin dioxygenase-like cupin family protein
MNHSKNARVQALVVRAIEGIPTKGALLVKPLIKGDHMSLLEVHLQPGVASATHVHSHESLVYVVRGTLKTTVGNKTYVLGPGDVCRHPHQVAHRIEALEETLIVEIKSPAPDIANILTT